MCAVCFPLINKERFIRKRCCGHSVAMGTWCGDCVPARRRPRWPAASVCLFSSLLIRSLVDIVRDWREGNSRTNSAINFHWSECGEVGLVPIGRKIPRRIFVPRNRISRCRASRRKLSASVCWRPEWGAQSSAIGQRIGYVLVARRSHCTANAARIFYRLAFVKGFKL